MCGALLVNVCERVSNQRSVGFVLIPYSLSDLFCVAAEKITYMHTFYLDVCTFAHSSA